MQMTTRTFLIFSVSTLLTQACAPQKPENFKEERALFAYAEKLYADENYSDSIPYYESLRNRFATSPLAIESELRIADAYYEANKNDEAEVAYQSFRTLHPTHPKVTHVVYRLAMTHRKRAPKSVDRDQVQTELALGLFRELLAQWPQSEEAKLAAPEIEKLRKRLVEKELYVGNFYLRQKKYEAAIGRLAPVRDNSEFPVLQAEAAYKMGLAHYKLKQYSEAKALLKAVETFPEAGEFKEKAKELLGDIPATTEK